MSLRIFELMMIPTPLWLSGAPPDKKTSWLLGVMKCSSTSRVYVSVMQQLSKRMASKSTSNANIRWSLKWLCTFFNMIWKSERMKNEECSSCLPLRSGSRSREILHWCEDRSVDSLCEKTTLEPGLYGKVLDLHHFESNWETLPLRCICCDTWEALPLRR